MVSKSILFALSIVALACNAASTDLSTSSGSESNVVELNPCIGSIGQIDAFFSLNLRVDRLLAQVLGVAVNLIRAVLRLVGGLLATVIGVVQGLVNGLFLGKKPSVPAPHNLGKLLGVLSVGLLAEDRALRVYFGAQIYKRDYLRNCFCYCVIKIMQNEGINISGSNWSWCKLDNGFNAETWYNELSIIIDQVDDGVLTSLLNSIGQFLQITLIDVELLVGNLLGGIVSILFNGLIGFSRQCGYTSYQASHNCVISAYKPILEEYNCGTIDVGVLTGGDYSIAIVL